MIIEINKSTDWSKIEPIKNLIIGYFDGLHYGHLSLFENLSDFSILIIKNVPSKFYNNLYDLDQRIEQLLWLKPNQIFIYDIKQNNCTAKEFIQNFLIKLNPYQIIVGSNFIFGSDQKNIFYLVNKINTNAKKIIHPYSSTYIRHLIQKNKFKKVNKLLYKPYYIIGNVTHGYANGKKINYPTANLEINNNLMTLNDGVYVSRTRLNNIYYDSISFIGQPKTIRNDSKKFFETYLLNYHGSDFYNKEIKVEILAFLRKNKKFNSIEKLKKAISKDIKKAKKFW